MASLALPLLRSSPLVRFSLTLLSRQPSPSSLVLSAQQQRPPSFLLAALSPSPSLSLIPDALQSLRDLLPGWVLAVPKSKTSHSKKSMRSSGKGLKEQQGIVACPSCGAAKRAHHLCHECHVDFRRTFHQEVKDKDAGVPVER